MRKTLCLRRAFTLVELLIVIAIIAILALLTTCMLRAFRMTCGNRGAFELSQLAQAIETYRQNHAEYPPDFTSNAATGEHIDACYHRYKGGLPACMDVTQEQHLDPSEALVFWLGALNRDPGSPFPSAAATPAAIQANRRSLFDFNPKQLRDFDGDGWLSYCPAWSDQPAPYVYFNARTYAGARWTHPANRSVAAPYYADGGAEFIEPSGFQLISAGRDGNFGAASTARKQFKSGLNYTAFDEDNITSFSQGTTLGANRP